MPEVLASYGRGGLHLDTDHSTGRCFQHAVHLPAITILKMEHANIDVRAGTQFAFRGGRLSRVGRRGVRRRRRLKREDIPEKLLVSWSRHAPRRVHRLGGPLRHAGQASGVTKRLLIKHGYLPEAARRGQARAGADRIDGPRNAAERTCAIPTDSEKMAKVAVCGTSARGNGPFLKVTDSHIIALRGQPSTT